MKTLQDLVDNLNQYFSEEGQFKIDYYDYDKIFEICCENDCGEYDLIEIDPKDRSWLLETDIGYQTSEVQHTIVDFLVNSNPNDWLDDDNDDDEIVVDGIQMTKKQADQLYEYFTKKQAENLNKEMDRLKDHFDKVRDLWNM